MTTVGHAVLDLTAPRKARLLSGRDFDVARAFTEHGSLLLGIAANALGDRHAAEDCVQETLVRAWRARESFNPSRGSERTWLVAITRHVISTPCGPGPVGPSTCGPRCPNRRRSPAWTSGWPTGSPWSPGSRS